MDFAGFVVFSVCVCIYLFVILNLLISVSDHSVLSQGYDSWVGVTSQLKMLMEEKHKEEEPPYFQMNEAGQIKRIPQLVKRTGSVHH